MDTSSPHPLPSLTGEETPLDVEKLREIASAANQDDWRADITGHWAAQPRVYSYRADGEVDQLLAVVGNADRSAASQDEWNANARYMAAARPKTMLRLLSALAEQQRFAAGWHRTVETILTIAGLSPALGADEAAAAVQARIAELESKAEEAEAETGIFQREAGEHLKTLDAIAEMIGMPHDEELSSDHVRQFIAELERERDEERRVYHETQWRQLQEAESRATAAAERAEELEHVSGERIDALGNEIVALRADLSAAAEREAAAVERERVSRDELRRIQRTGEMSAEIMRDARRTGGWEGSERPARAFERIAHRARAARSSSPARGSDNLLYEIWCVPTAEGREAFGWFPHRVTGGISKAEAEKAVHEVDTDISPDARKYRKYEIRPSPATGDLTDDRLRWTLEQIRWGLRQDGRVWLLNVAGEREQGPPLREFIDAALSSAGQGAPCKRCDGRRYVYDAPVDPQLPAQTVPCPDCAAGQGGTVSELSGLDEQARTVDRINAALPRPLAEHFAAEIAGQSTQGAPGDAE